MPRAAMMRAAAILALSACAGTDWDDVPGARLRPVSLDPAVDAARWRAAVAGAADEWGDALEPFGCPRPFVGLVDVGAHPVRLIAPADWEFDGADGATWGDAPTQPAGGISIVTDADARRPTGQDEWRSVLLHELGHAIGLEHADPQAGPSVMWEANQIGGEWSAPHLEPADVDAARITLGC